VAVENDRVIVAPGRSGYYPRAL